MDRYGIGFTLKTMLTNYFQSARGTGKTSLLLDQLQDGDCVVFTNASEANRVSKLALREGLQIRTKVCSIGEVSRLSDQLQGISERIIFDHSFVEEFHINSLEQTVNYLEAIENMHEHKGGKRCQQ